MRLLPAVLLLSQALILSYAAGQTPGVPGVPGVTGVPASPATGPRSAEAAPSDIAFLNQAITAAEAGLEAARVAIIKGEDAMVRKFGREAIVDYTASIEALKRLASQHGIRLDNEREPTVQKRLDTLERLSGKAFDRHYAQWRRAEHADMLQLYQQQAGSGTGAFRNFAELALPRLKEREKLLEHLP